MLPPRADERPLPQVGVFPLAPSGGGGGVVCLQGSRLFFVRGGAVCMHSLEDGAERRLPAQFEEVRVGP